MLNGRVMAILLIVGLIKKTWIIWVNVFLKLRLLEGNVKVELDLCNYAAKMDLKNTAGVDMLKFDTSRVDLAGLK